MFTRSILFAAVAMLMLGAAANVAPPVAAPVPSIAAYHLAPGDKLRITVFGEERLSGEYSLTPAGNVAFPLIGLVQADGKSVEEVQALITARLAAGYVNDPRVSAEVITFRPYYILGEVTRPGAFPFAVGLTLDQAVASAGGFTYRANHRRAFLRRAGDAKEHMVDLRAGTVAIAPGDTIRIGERYF
ncbi:polysaccharide export protein [Polymorphobacter sp. PAMC 29334]|uniref:polysaccharide biosynthesis/export family protein n=1 Tax=Polymorphobacter sp. PAMC 29334 TaxID=2862331 RepID=UPI001C687046|nr:polysaccharide biosynthesis/export family protein [Polymorphobacter sp. PAMC 29334]QYE35056.1 polysaccharide export protein [Polymorphobacter sp. PAMC 29334]